MSEIPDNSIRLIITSPPYFNVKDYGIDHQIGLSSQTYEHFIESMLPVWKECYRILKPNGKLCINSPLMPMEKKAYSTHYNRDVLNINNDIEQNILKHTDLYRFGLIIWDKGSTDQLMMGSYPFPPNFYFLNTVEFINIYVKDGQPEKMDPKIKEASRLDKETWRNYISTIWRFAPENDRSHPAPFPVELPARLIRLFSFVDDVIVDPFMGSGTTAVAAVQCGRKYIGYEINPQYVKLTEQRLGVLRQGQMFHSKTADDKESNTVLSLLREALKDEIFNESFIEDCLHRGMTVEEILVDLSGESKVRV